MNERRWGKRSEAERQELIRELMRLRREGLSVNRQDVILETLRTEFELGWPAVSVWRCRSSDNGVQP